MIDDSLWNVKQYISGQLPKCIRAHVNTVFGRKMEPNMLQHTQTTSIKMHSFGKILIIITPISRSFERAIVGPNITMW